ncbi:MAG: hypothetical protein ACQ5SW_00175, partial [Sphaerochaetaceae bacterium]
KANTLSDLINLVIADGIDATGFGLLNGMPIQMSRMAMIVPFVHPSAARWDDLTTVTWEGEDIPF